MKERPGSHTIGPGCGIRTPRYTSSQNLRKPGEIRGEGLQETPPTLSQGDVLEHPLLLHRAAEQGVRMNITKLSSKSVPRISKTTPRACHGGFQSHSQERSLLGTEASFRAHHLAQSHFPSQRPMTGIRKTKQKKGISPCGPGATRGQVGGAKGKASHHLGGNFGNDGVRLFSSFPPICMRSSQSHSSEISHMVTLAPQAPLLASEQGQPLLSTSGCQLSSESSLEDHTPEGQYVLLLLPSQE